MRDGLKAAIFALFGLSVVTGAVQLDRWWRGREHHPKDLAEAAELIAAKGWTVHADRLGDLKNAQALAIAPEPMERDEACIFAADEKNPRWGTRLNVYPIGRTRTLGRIITLDADNVVRWGDVIVYGDMRLINELGVK